MSWMTGVCRGVTWGVTVKAQERRKEELEKGRGDRPRKVMPDSHERSQKPLHSPHPTLTHTDLSLDNIY